MLQHLNQHTVANDVRMRATTFKGAFVLVEGRSDQKLYIKFTDPAHTQVLLCKNRTEVFAAIHILNADGFTRAVAIVDADFDRIEGVNPPSDNVFYTDGHDAEMMMIACTQAYNALIAEFASPDKLAEWQKGSGRPLLDSAIGEVARIGALMLHSRRSAAHYDFGSFKNGLKFADFTHNKTLEINDDLLIQHVLNRSGQPRTPRDPIHASIAGIRSSGYDNRDLGRGHDLLDLIGVGLRHAIGSCDQQEGSGWYLEKFLRVAYPIDCFRATNLYRDVQHWAATHGPLQVFN